MDLLLTRSWKCFIALPTMFSAMQVMITLLVAPSCPLLLFRNAISFAAADGSSEASIATTCDVILAAAVAISHLTLILIRNY